MARRNRFRQVVAREMRSCRGIPAPSPMKNAEADWTLDIPSRIERRGRALTVKELAELIHLSTKQIYALVQGGKVPFYRIDGAIRFDPHHIAEWLRARAA